MLRLGLILSILAICPLWAKFAVAEDDLSAKIVATKIECNHPVKLELGPCGSRTPPPKSGSTEKLLASGDIARGSLAHYTMEKNQEFLRAGIQNLILVTLAFPPAPADFPFELDAQGKPWLKNGFGDAQINRYFVEKNFNQPVDPKLNIYGIAMQAASAARTQWEEQNFTAKSNTEIGIDLRALRSAVFNACKASPQSTELAVEKFFTDHASLRYLALTEDFNKVFNLTDNFNAACRAGQYQSLNLESRSSSAMLAMAPKKIRDMALLECSKEAKDWQSIINEHSPNPTPAIKNKAFSSNSEKAFRNLVERHPDEVIQLLDKSYKCSLIPVVEEQIRRIDNADNAIREATSAFSIVLTTGALVTGQFELLPAARIVGSYGNYANSLNLKAIIDKRNRERQLSAAASSKKGDGMTKAIIQAARMTRNQKDNISVSTAIEMPLTLVGGSVTGTVRKTIFKVTREELPKRLPQIMSTICKSPTCGSFAARVAADGVALAENPKIAATMLGMKAFDKLENLTPGSQAEWDAYNRSLQKDIDDMDVAIKNCTASSGCTHPGDQVVLRNMKLAAEQNLAIKNATRFPAGSSSSSKPPKR